MPRRRNGRGLGGYLGEVVLIVLGVLLGLAANEWRVNLGRQAETRLALRRIRNEVATNTEQLRSAAPVHAAMGDSLGGLAGAIMAGRGQPDGLFRLRRAFPNGFSTPLLERTAWDVALRTGTAAHMDHDTLLLLSRYYALLDFCQQKLNRVPENLYLAVNTDPAHWRGLILALAMVTGDIAIQEQRLVTFGDTLLARLPAP